MSTTLYSLSILFVIWFAYYMVHTEKTISHTKWFFNVVPIGIIGLLSAPLVYPFAQLIEYILPNHNPLWWWLDDEIDDPEQNEDWLIYCNGKPNNIIYRYLWHAFRNTLWNLKSLIRPWIARIHCISNDEEMVEVITDELYRNGEKVDIYGNCLEVAQYKWIDKYGNEGWQVWSGERISEKYSTVGELEYWYRANDRLYYRYSIAEKRKMTFLKTGFPFIHRTDGYYNFKMGATDKGYTFVLKRKKIKND